MGEKRQGDIEDDGDDAKRLKPDDEVDGDGSEDDEDEDDETGSDEDDDEDDEDDDTDGDSEEEEELDLVMREDGRVHAPAVDYLELDMFRTFPDLVQGLDQDAELHAHPRRLPEVFTARSVKKETGGGAKQQYSSGGDVLDRRPGRAEVRAGAPRAADIPPARHGRGEALGG